MRRISECAKNSRVRGRPSAVPHGHVKLGQIVRTVCGQPFVCYDRCIVSNGDNHYFEDMPIAVLDQKWLVRSKEHRLRFAAIDSDIVRIEVGALRAVENRTESAFKPWNMPSTSG